VAVLDTGIDATHRRGRFGPPAPERVIFRAEDSPSWPRAHAWKAC
jgi:hypothetical protein